MRRHHGLAARDQAERRLEVAAKGEHLGRALEAQGSEITDGAKARARRIARGAPRTTRTTESSTR
jgi:hypothetical protein